VVLRECNFSYQSAPYNAKIMQLKLHACRLQ
jgi:hypothetical protein